MMMIDQGWTDARKGRYDGECAKVDTMAVRGTVDKEVGLRQLISFESQNVDSGW